MIKSEIKRSYVAIKSLPKLMINKTNDIIILANSQDDHRYVGTIVYSKNTLYNPIGKYSENWINFEDFYGEITLSNEIVELCNT